MTAIWVVNPDHGYEGLSDPVAAFLSEEEAKQYAAHLEKGYASYAVNEAPLMRFVPAKIEPATLEAVEVKP